MTRFIFGGGPEDVYLVQDPATGFFKPGPGAQALFYADTAKSNRYTDLQTLSGQPITFVTTEPGGGVWTAGQIAPFIGPDNVTEMYVSVSGSPPFLMQASAFGSFALPLLAQVQQLYNRPLPSLAGLTDVDAASIGNSAVGQALVKLANGSWGAGSVASGGGSGDATLAGTQTFTGAKTFAALLTAAAQLLAKPASASGVAAVVQGLASQTGNLQEWRNSSGTAMSLVDPAGNIYAANLSTTITMTRAGALSAGVGTYRWYADRGMALQIRSVRASVGTPSTSGTPTFDVNVNGTSIFTTQSNRPTLAVGSNTTGRLTGFAVNSSIPDGGYLTVDIDVAGTGAADAVVQVEVW